MDYGQILSRSWRITWNNKFLWVLGFLAALVRVSSNTSSYRTSSSNIGPEDIEQIMQGMALLVGLCCFFMVIGLVVWLLSLVARGGMITAVSRIDNGESATLGDSFRAGTERILTLVGMHIVLYLPLMLLAVVGIGGSFMLLAGSGITFASIVEEPSAAGEAVAATLGMFVLCMCLAVCGLVLLGLFLQFINAFAFRGIMLRGLGAMASISHGWQVFKANMAEVLLLAVLFFVISFIFSFVVGLVLIPFALVFFVPLMALSADGGMNPFVLFVMAGGGLCLGLLGAALASVLVTWQSAAFTLAYEEWTGAGGKLAKVEEV